MDKNDVARLLSKTRKLVARYHILEREMIKLRETLTMFASIYQYYWREKTRRTEDFSMKETPSYYREYIEETHKVIREDEQGKEPSDVVREVERHFCAKEEKERRDGTSRSHPPRRVRDGDSGEGANGG